MYYLTGTKKPMAAFDPQSETLMIRGYLMGALVAASLASAAQAGDGPTLRVTNHVRGTMTGFYASPVAGKATSKTRGANFLRRPIPPGKSDTVTIKDRHGICRFDIHVDFKLGGYLDSTDFNVCDQAGWEADSFD